MPYIEKEVFKMKMKEALKQIYPEFVRKKSCGGAFGCPSWYGFENSKPAYCKLEEKTCRKCWNRKYEPMKAES